MWMRTIVVLPLVLGAWATPRTAPTRSDKLVRCVRYRVPVFDNPRAVMRGPTSTREELYIPSLGIACLVNWHETFEPTADGEWAVDWTPRVRAFPVPDPEFCYERTSWTGTKPERLGEVEIPESVALAIARTIDSEKNLADVVLGRGFLRSPEPGFPPKGMRVSGGGN